MERAETYEASGGLTELCKHICFSKFCAVEEGLRVMKSLGFFSSWVVKRSRHNWRSVLLQKWRYALYKGSVFLSKHQQTEEAAYKVLACLYCRASQQLLSKCSLLLLMATNAITGGFVPDVDRPFEHQSFFQHVSFHSFLESAQSFTSFNFRE